jgi:ATP-binding cassette subfamily C (CFTR/MRP) protein 10
MYNKLESTEDAANSKDNFSTGLFFNIFNPILAIGYSRSLTFQDIPELPYKLKCEHSFQKLRSLIRKKVDNKPNKKSEPKLTNFRLSFLYFWTLTKCYYQPILYLNLVKLVSSVLSFFFPVLLGVYVDYFDNFESSNEYLLKGCIITFILFASQVLSSVLNSHFTIAAAKFELELKGANILAVFKTSIGFKLSEKSYSKLSNSKLLNIVQIDVEKAVETIKSFIDLWSIPLQVVIAFILLYYQVKLAFLAGLAAIVLMIPINSLIAKNIANATTKLMIQKDSRIAILSESFKGILGLKCGGLETDILNLSNAYRKKEVRYLSIRKYLDAVCVYLWATMPILVPYATFTASLLVVGSEDLDSAKVLTTLALLNMLIFPMNAFPWVLNGIMEGLPYLYRYLCIVIEEC